LNITTKTVSPATPSSQWCVAWEVQTLLSQGLALEIAKLLRSSEACSTQFLLQHEGTEVKGTQGNQGDSAV